MCLAKTGKKEQIPQILLMFTLLSLLYQNHDIWEWNFISYPMAPTIALWLYSIRRKTQWNELCEWNKANSTMLRTLKKIDTYRQTDKLKLNTLTNWRTNWHLWEIDKLIYCHWCCYHCFHCQYCCFCCCCHG